MATEKIALEIEVKGAGSVKELKQGIKDAKNELLQFEVGSEGFARAQKKVSSLTDSLKDLGDSASIQGTGVERLGQSFSLLGQSFASGDLDKGKLALTGIGQAVSAIPIFLLLQGIQYLIQNFDKLIEFIPGLQSIVDVFNELTDAIGLTNHAQNKLYEDAINNSKRATESAIAYYDKEIAILKAAGQETFLLEQQKREEYRLTLDAQAKVIQDRALLDKKLTDEQLKQLEDLDKAQKQSLVDSEVAEIEYGIRIQKERDDRYNDQKKKNEENLKATLHRIEEEEKLFYNKQGADLAKQAEADAILAQQRLTAEQDYLNKQSELDKQFAALSKEQKDKDLNDEILRNKKLVDDKKKSEEAKKQAVGVSLNAAASLSAAFFAMQLNGAKGNAREELKIRKQQFEVEKSFNVARAIIDGVRAVQATLATPPLAIANGILAAANVAKIISTKFDGGAASAGGDTQSSASSLPQTNTPIPNIPQSNGFNSTQVNGGNSEVNVSNGMGNRVYVVESDITQTQSKVSRIQRTSVI